MQTYSIVHAYESERAHSLPKGHPPGHTRPTTIQYPSFRVPLLIFAHSAVLLARSNARPPTQPTSNPFIRRQPPPHYSFYFESLAKKGLFLTLLEPGSLIVGGAFFRGESMFLPTKKSSGRST